MSLMKFNVTCPHAQEIVQCHCWNHYPNAIVFQPGLQLFWRSSARRFYQQVPGFRKGCDGRVGMSGYWDGGPDNWPLGDMPYFNVAVYAGLLISHNQAAVFCRLAMNTLEYITVNNLFI